MRLIDADALIEMIDNDIDITKRFMNKSTNPLEMASRNYISLVSQLNTLKSFREIIKEQPTAYDVAKVVAKLEQKKGTYFDGLTCEGMKIRINDAIDIVRKGGVE